MQYCIAYDIAESKIRSKVVRYLESFSYRIQYSVFLCDIDSANLALVKRTLIELTAGTDKKRILIAPVYESIKARLWVLGDTVEEKQQCIVL